MKKIMIALMAILILTTGCTAKEDNKENNNSNVNSQEVGKKEVKGTITYEGADVTPGKSFNEKSIAETAQKSELPSCALEGMDHVYRYSNVEITANVKDGKETIYSVYFITEDAKTPEGVGIGDSKDKMINTYGNGYTNDVSVYTYLSDNGKVNINFQIENDVITSIDYTQVIK